VIDGLHRHTKYAATTTIHTTRGARCTRTPANPATSSASSRREAARGLDASPVRIGLWHYVACSSVVPTSKDSRCAFSCCNRWMGLRLLPTKLTLHIIGYILHTGQSIINHTTLRIAAILIQHVSQEKPHILRGFCI